MLYNMGKMSWLLVTNETKFFRPRLSSKLQMYEFRAGAIRDLRHTRERNMKVENNVPHRRTDTAL